MLQISVQSVPITTKVVVSNPVHIGILLRKHLPFNLIETFRDQNDRH
jgi:hypothetical protein